MSIEKTPAAEPVNPSREPDQIPRPGGEGEGQAHRGDQATGSDRSGRQTHDEIGSLAPDQAGKGPITITRAGEPGSGADTRSSAAATRST